MNKKKVKSCRCDNCEHCRNILHEKRRSFYCDHSNYAYIADYFRKKRINAAPGFIGYGENYKDVPSRKRTPGWCPLRIREGENHE